MKRAVISDIHADLAALQQVLVDIAGERIAEIICWGTSSATVPIPGRAWSCRGGSRSASWATTRREYEPKLGYHPSEDLTGGP